ncbi:MAG: Ig-like domain-containing protein [Nitrospiraceae bacterium]|nr:Ig-like domain-containing protein [Nitrospiraceae bacterium]
MTKRTIFGSAGAIIALAALVACSSTIKTIRTSLVTVTVSAQKAVALAIEPATPWSRLARALVGVFDVPAAHAAIPADVQTITLTVTGPGMDTIISSQNVAGQTTASFTVEVPNGQQRLFVVEGLDSNKTMIYQGQATADLDGNPATITLNMQNFKVPQVVSTIPVPNATDVDVAQPIQATFSDLMDATTVNKTTFLVKDIAGNPVGGTVIFSGVTATFTPGSSLASLATYTATITTGAKSAAGIAMAQNYAWSFTTRDAIPSAVVATDPANGAVGVPLNALVTAVFSKPMDTATLNTSTFLLADSGATAIPGTVLASSTTATFTPTSNLTLNMLYSATITTGAQDANGMPMAAKYTWSFTVGDTVPPTFAGLSSVTASLTSAQLNWAAATDNLTPAASIVYLIYYSTTPAIIYAAPAFVTTPGATSYTVPGLAPGTTYYFAVRARDAAGNIDSNIVELQSSYPGKFVTASTGTDTAGCGTQASPCKTITFALSQSTGTEGIFVSAGTYSTAETFPLQLKPGTNLACLGASYSTVISSASTTAIMGAANAVIDGCRIDTPPSGVAAINDLGAAMTVNNINMQNPTFGFATGMQLSGNSKVQNSQFIGLSLQSSGVAINIAGGSPSISLNTIAQGYIGINVAGGNPSITGNTFRSNLGIANDGAGIQITGTTGSAMISSNTFTGNYLGMLITGGTSSIMNNTVTSNIGTGISLPIGAGTPTATVSGNMVSANGTGIDVQTGTVAISGNTINLNTGSGISVSAFGVPIAGNTINNNGTGISLNGSTSSATINNNSLYCNTSADLMSTSISVIDATLNAWDHDATTAPPGPLTGIPTCAPGTDICATGTVTFTPFNTAVPSPPACR